MNRIGFMSIDEYLYLREKRNNLRDKYFSSKSERWQLASIKEMDKELEKHERQFPEDILEYNRIKV